MSRTLGVALPFWLDRPDQEALKIARAAERAGIERVWVGEMRSFDAFALATAIGLQTKRTRLTVGPVAVAVRSPVSIALGVASVATLIGRPVDVALGSSSPAIVSGWHDRPWAGLAGRMRETTLALHALLAQLAGQLAIYLGAPGYGELFAGIGFAALVDAARDGVRRAELSSRIPPELLARIGALGPAGEIATRLAAYHDAGADHVAVVPSTAEDRAGTRLLEVVAGR